MEETKGYQRNKNSRAITNKKKDKKINSTHTSVEISQVKDPLYTALFASKGVLKNVSIYSEFDISVRLVIKTEQGKSRRSTVIQVKPGYNQFENFEVDKGDLIKLTYLDNNFKENFSPIVLSYILIHK